MTTPDVSSMADATRLTRQGRLAEATALLQQSLRGSGYRTTPLSLPDAPAGGRRPGPPPGPGSPAPRPAGRFDAFSYANAAGARSYRLYLPSGTIGAPTALVVMLHGGTQNAATFAAATGLNDLAERERFLVAYPEQPRSANAGRYWNWFEPDHQRRDRGEPSLIAGITAQVMRAYPVDPARVYVAGFSAGGAMAAVMGAAYADLYAAVGVHSGLAYASATDVASALAAMKHGPPAPTRTPTQHVPLIVFHGDRDQTVAHANAAGLIDQILAGVAGATAETTRGRVPGGHGYSRTCYVDANRATVAESWTIHQGGHNWSGGVADASYTDPRGPNATAELVRFFDQHPNARMCR